MDERSLAGLRILVTRAEEQAEELASKLESLGATAVKLPLIRIAPPDDERPLSEAIQKVLAQGYDWVVFTSVHGVRTFFDWLQKFNAHPQTLNSVKFAVIGSATGKVLEQFGFKPAAMPEKFTNEGLAELFERILRDCQSERSLNFLLWRAAGAREILAKKLQQLGAVVHEVHAYKTVPNRLSESQLQDILKEPVHIVTFTSPSTVRAFFEVLGKERAISVLESVTIAVIGPVTEQACKEFGLEPQIVAEIHTVDGLVNAIVTWAKETRVG